MRPLTQVLVALALSCAGLVSSKMVQAAPALYVYTGPGYQGRALTYRFENMLGRKVDGVTDFDDFTSPMTALGAMNSGLPAWCGQGWGVSIRFPAAFSNMTLQQVAAGDADAQYRAMFDDMQKCIAPAKYVSIGHEMNGGPYYPWAAKGGAAFIAAYKHIFAIGRTHCPSCKLTWNPGMSADPRAYYPGDMEMDELDWDYYPEVYSSGGVYAEPTFTAANTKGYWMLYAAGPASGQGWKASQPVGFPEMGVGGESNGKGVCPAKNPSGCDDGPLTATVLAYMIKTGATRFSWWDFDGGGYNALLSDGLRPAEFIALCQLECTPAVAKLLAGATPYTGSIALTTPGLVHVLLKLASGRILLIGWAPSTSKVTSTFTASQPVVFSGVNTKSKVHWSRPKATTLPYYEALPLNQALVYVDP